MTEHPRTKRLRTALNETQDEFAARLGVSQGTIYRLEGGQPETGPQRLLLDAIEATLAASSSPPLSSGRSSDGASS